MKFFNKTASALPDHNFTALTDITPADIRAMGAKAVAIDLDNTALLDSSYHMPESTKDWVAQMKEAGIPVAIVSNTFIHRGIYLSHRLGNIPFVAPAFKPFPLCLVIAAKWMKVKPGEVAMIGDQLFTDILTANRIDAVSVKVEPIEKEKLFASHFVKIRRKERRYLAAFRKAEAAS